MIRASWPEKIDIDLSDAVQMDHMMEIIKQVRNIRAEMNVPPSRKAKVILVTKDPAPAFTEAAKYLQRLAYASEVELTGEKPTGNVVSIVSSAAEVYIPLGELVDIEKELERLGKEKKNLEQEIQRANGKLSNTKFVEKAPEAVVQEERNKLAKYQDMLGKVEERLAALEKAR